MPYVDGFVCAVPTKNKEAFRKHAADAAEWFKKQGALSVLECWGDDVPEGEVTSFSMAVKRKEDETVVFSWVTWPTKEIRDATYAKMQDEMPGPESMPFDGKRMIYGGFVPIVEL